MASNLGNTKENFRRLAGWAVGAGAQLAFVATVIGLYLFLAGWTAKVHHPWLLWDVGLALQFAVPHSLLRLPRVQKAISQRMGREFYGVIFCWATCLSLSLVIVGWRDSDAVAWTLPSAASAVAQIAFHVSWVALAYSMHLTGIGYQTGLTEWNCWRRRQQLPRRQFVPRGAYAWLRHPIYLSFLGLIWFCPTMTADRLVLAVIWTAYIAVGSYLKDERLAFFMGQEYRDYQARVPGYPGLHWGPLGLRRVETRLKALA